MVIKSKNRKKRVPEFLGEMKRSKSLQSPKTDTVTSKEGL